MNPFYPRPLPVFQRGFQCEIPNQVGQRCFAGVHEMLDFLRENGATEWHYDNEFGVWRVPAWREGIEAESARIQRHCDRYGCE